MQEFDAAGVTGIVWRRVDPGREAEAEALMHRIMLLAREAEGYLGTEIFPPIPGVQDAYVVLYRFDRGENLRRWLGSAWRQELLRQMETMLVEPPFEFFFSHRRRNSGTASSVFSYRVRPECEDAFRDWRRRILAEVRTWEGFLGTESFDTLDSAQPEFVVVVRFNNRANLDAWLTAPKRQAFMKEVQEYVEHFHLRRIGSGFEGWFDISENKPPPTRWRQALLVLTALFPVIMLMRQILAPLFLYLPFPVAFLILLFLDMAVLTYGVMPRFSRLMNFWLQPGPGSTWRTEIAGAVVIGGILSLSLALTLWFDIR